MLADGLPYRTIQEKLETTAPTTARWRLRFEEQRVAGLLEIRHPGQKPSVITPALQAKVLELSRRRPSDGSTHWSCRKLAPRLHVSKYTVQRFWRKAFNMLDRCLLIRSPEPLTLLAIGFSHFGMINDSAQAEQA
jgi:transposase